MAAFSETAYAPGLSVTRVPASLPGKLAGLGAVPVTVIVQLSAEALPPLSFTTCLMTVSVVGGTSSFVITQVFVSLTAIVPVQSLERLFVYPAAATSSTL